MSGMSRYLGKRYSNFWRSRVNQYVFSGLAITLCGVAVSFLVPSMKDMAIPFELVGVFLGGVGVGYDKGAREEARKW